MLKSPLLVLCVSVLLHTLFAEEMVLTVLNQGLEGVEFNTKVPHLFIAEPECDGDIDISKHICALSSWGAHAHRVVVEVRDSRVAKVSVSHDLTRVRLSRNGGASLEGTCRGTALIELHAHCASKPLAEL